MVPGTWFNEKSPFSKALKLNTFGDPTIISRFANIFSFLNEIFSFIFSLSANVCLFRNQLLLCG
jgi:hypothetical protein